MLIDAILMENIFDKNGQLLRKNGDFVSALQAVELFKKSNKKLSECIKFHCPACNDELICCNLKKEPDLCKKVAHFRGHNSDCHYSQSSEKKTDQEKSVVSEKDNYPQQLLCPPLPNESDKKASLLASTHESVDQQIVEEQPKIRHERTSYAGIKNFCLYYVKQYDELKKKYGKNNYNKIFKELVLKKLYFIQNISNYGKGIKSVNSKYIKENNQIVTRIYYGKVKKWLKCSDGYLIFFKEFKSEKVFINRLPLILFIPEKILFSDEKERIEKERKLDFLEQNARLFFYGSPVELTYYYFVVLERFRWSYLHSEPNNKVVSTEVAINHDQYLNQKKIQKLAKLALVNAESATLVEDLQPKIENINSAPIQNLSAKLSDSDTTRPDSLSNNEEILKLLSDEVIENFAEPKALKNIERSRLTIREFFNKIKRLLFSS